MKLHYPVPQIFLRPLFAMLVIVIPLAGLPGTQAKIIEFQESDTASLVTEHGDAAMLTATACEDKSQLGHCQLLHTDLNANVAALVARVKLHQIFQNNLNKKIDVSYSFPLPKNASLKKLLFKVGDRKIQLAEERLSSQNLIRQTLSEVEPGERVEVELVYEDFVHYSREEFCFGFPRDVITNLSKDAPVIEQKKEIEIEESDEEDPDQVKKAPAQPDPAPRYLNLTLDVNTGAAIRTMHSTTHLLDIELPSPSRACVSLKNIPKLPQTDFSLVWSLAGKGVNSGYITYKRPDDDGFFSLVLVPPTMKDERGNYLPGSKKDVPLLTDINVRFYGLKISDLFPDLDPVLLSSRPLYLIGRYSKEGRGRALISGKFGTDTFKQLIAVQLPKSELQSEGLESIWEHPQLQTDRQSDGLRLAVITLPEE